MTSPVPTVGHRSCLDEAFRVLQEQSAPAVGVIDAEGRLIGLITAETIGEMLMMREALPDRLRSGPGPAVRPEPDRGSSNMGLGPRQ